MALSFPLALTAFLDLLPVAELQFNLGESLVADQTGRGEVLTAALGARLWQGSLTLAPARFAALGQQRARIELVRQPGRAFLITDLSKAGPAADPTGAILGGAAPKMSGMQSGGRELRIKDLPPGYVLSDGDMLSFVYGATQALHQIVVGGSADGAGLSSWLEVVPEVRAGWAVNAAVTLLRPVCRALIVPGSAGSAQMAGATGRGLSLQFIQTLG